MPRRGAKSQREYPRPRPACIPDPTDLSGLGRDASRPLVLDAAGPEWIAAADLPGG
ncbi:hypothetical protein ACFV2Z_24770 [Streptomyces sp. NPDC059688]|uniref:Uncharacterized protein n=1 Tax=Streptomyces sp. 900105245 TaxID=3154379 RepID=A0ABV1UAT9_9ACTN|nr:hypothetical protein [Streptomyces sp. PanSC9]